MRKHHVLCTLTLCIASACNGASPADSDPAAAAGTTDMSEQPTAILDAFDIAAIKSQLGPMPTEVVADPSNQYSANEQAAALGKKLYFEDRYSSTGDMSCATCHAPENGFQDPRGNTSPGVNGTTGRRAPSHLNIFVGKSGETADWYFWDGRKDSLWAQALGPPESYVEMGSTRTKVVLLLWDKYREEYESVFGTMPALRDANDEPLAPETAMPGTDEWDALSQEQQDTINGVYANFGKAIDAYERRLVSGESKFDRYWAQVDAGNPDSDLFTDQEKLGLKTFVGKGRCMSCHSGPAFSNNEFTNIAVQQVGDNVPAEDPGRAGGIEGVLGDEFNCAGQFSDHPDKDNCAVASLTADDRDLGAFKVPGLRDISTRSPYMHTGMLTTLEETVEHYNKGGDSSGFVGTPHEDIVELNLTDEEAASLVAFMEALDGGPLPAQWVDAPVLPD